MTYWQLRAHDRNRLRGYWNDRDKMCDDLLTGFSDTANMTLFRYEGGRYVTEATGEAVRAMALRWQGRDG